MINILVVDDHTMFRQALMAVLLEQMPTGSIHCDDVGSVDAARKLLMENVYDLIILDISMPVLSGIDYLPELADLYPSIPVLMLSMHTEEQFALKALRLGALGYICKKEAADELLSAIDSLLKGKRYLSSSLSASLIDHLLMQQVIVEEPAHLKLSRREMEIFRKFARGKKLKEISEELGISVKTVYTYKSRLCAKMGFKGRTGIISYALAHNIV